MQLSQGSKWIWVNNCTHDKNCYCEFADKFIADNPNAGAQVRICADSRYVLWINGHFAGLGQYTDYPERAIFNTIDISEFITAGENTLRILVYYKGTPSPTYSHNIPGLIFDVISQNKILAVSGSRTISRVSSAYTSCYSFSYDATKRPLNPWQSSLIVSNNLKLSPAPTENFKIKSRTVSTVAEQGTFFYHPEIANKVYTSKNTSQPFKISARVPFDFNSANNSGENGEYVTPSVIREMQEETGLTIEAPRLCGIKEFHKLKDGKRYIVFLYIADKFMGELKASSEGEIFWYPLSELAKSDKLIDGFGEMLPVFTNNEINEIYYERTADELKTIYC